MPFGFVCRNPLLSLNLPRKVLRPSARGPSVLIVLPFLEVGHLETGACLLRREVLAKGRFCNPLLHHIGGCTKKHRAFSKEEAHSVVTVLLLLRPHTLGLTVDELSQGSFSNAIRLLLHILGRQKAI